MRVLQFHNRQLSPGGADTVLQTERQALTNAGHVVGHVELPTADVLNEPLGKPKAFLSAIWGREARDRLGAAIDEFAPDVTHVHTLFPVASPAILQLLAHRKVPTVVTHHSYRLSCVRSDLRRSGADCHACVGRAFKAPALQHRCYQNSLVGSSALVLSSAIHGAIGSWKGVHTHIALSEFGEEQIALELGAEVNVEVSPNFLLHNSSNGLVVDPTSSARDVLFVGRLHPSKGVSEVLDAFESSDTTVTIVGEGPLQDFVAQRSRDSSNIEYLGRVQNSEIRDLMTNHRIVVVPSAWHEACPMVVLEAFASGRPVLAPSGRQFSSMVTPGVSGELFQSGAAGSLRSTAVRALSSDVSYPSQPIRDLFEEHFSEDVGVARLERIYRAATGG